MRWGAEFWLRVVIVAMFCVLIIKAPIGFIPIHYFFNYYYSFNASGPLYL